MSAADEQPLGEERTVVFLESATIAGAPVAYVIMLSAVVADGMINDRHDSNQELVAQGIANIACPFFGGIPATGAMTGAALLRLVLPVSVRRRLISSLHSLVSMLFRQPRRKRRTRSAICRSALLLR